MTKPETEPPAVTTPSAVEQMLRDCVPGGSICDPQQVADNIREWFSLQPVSDAEVSALEGRRAALNSEPFGAADEENEIYNEWVTLARKAVALLRRCTAGADGADKTIAQLQAEIARLNRQLEAKVCGDPRNSVTFPAPPAAGEKT